MEGSDHKKPMAALWGDVISGRLGHLFTIILSCAATKLFTLIVKVRPAISSDLPNPEDNTF